MTRRVRGPLDGPLLPCGPGFEAVLTGQGYSADSIGRHLRLMVHLSRWLAEQHLAAGDLTAGCARRFLRFRQAQGHRHPASMAGMAPLLDYLASVGAVPAAEPQDAGPAGALIAGYRRYLLLERGLSPQSTVPHYADVARRFVAHVRAGTPGELDGLTAAAVAGFVLSVSQRRSVGEAKAVSTRLRSFLRYLELEGLTRPGLLAAVPPIAGWLHDGRPRCASPAVFTRVLAPHRGLSDRAVSGVVRQACVRAGLPPMGSHRLRHTVATQTLRAGGTLTEVGHLLRQRSLAATSLYAKVDRGALSAVARPWPGGRA
jgi:integrase/recombinase XerD